MGAVDVKSKYCHFVIVDLVTGIVDFVAGSCGANEEYTTCGSLCPETCEKTGGEVGHKGKGGKGGKGEKGGKGGKEGKGGHEGKGGKGGKGGHDGHEGKGGKGGKGGKEGEGGKVEVVCPDVCVEGCFCKQGHVRNEKTGECVLPEQCPGKYLPAYLPS